MAAISKNCQDEHTNTDKKQMRQRKTDNHRQAWTDTHWKKYIFKIEFVNFLLQNGKYRLDPEIFSRVSK